MAALATRHSATASGMDAAAVAAACVWAWAVLPAVLECCWWQQLLAAWVAVELAYYAWHRCRYQVINRTTENRYSEAWVRRVKQRFLQLHGVMDIRAFCSGWFHGAPFESIRRGNVEDFVAYGFYCRTMDQLPIKLREATSAFVCAIEERWGIQLPDGRNTAITFMAHLWEPLRVIPKPLALHLGCEVMGAACKLALCALGFQRRHSQGFTYWLRRPAAPVPLSTLLALSEEPQTASRSVSGTLGSDGDAGSDCGLPPAALLAAAQAAAAHRAQPGGRDAGGHIGHRGDSFSSLRCGGGEAEPPRQGYAPRPIVFVHGVGLGLVPYVALIWQLLRACRGHPVLLVEVPHVALRLRARAAAVDDVAHAIAGILWLHGFADAAFVAHSYGTFVVSRVCQLHRAIVHSVALVDPVCFMTCFPHLLYNFVYKTPTLAELRAGGVAGLLNAARFVFSRDLIIAETFCRKFLWHELILWPEEMPVAALVVLSAADDLVPAELVRAHVKESAPAAAVMYHPTAGHGGFLLDFNFQAEMVRHIKRLAALPPAPEGKRGKLRPANLLP